MDVEKSKDFNAKLQDAKLAEFSVAENPKFNIKKFPMCLSNKSFKPFNGIFFALFSSMLLSLSNVFIKKAQITTGSEQALVRNIVQAIIMTITIVITKNTFFGPKNVRHYLVIRGMCCAVGMIALTFSMKLINPSDAASLVHLNTMITTVLARLFLKENLSIAHLAGLLVSAVGVLMITQPPLIFGTADVGNLTNLMNSTSVPQNLHEISHFDISRVNFIGGVSLGNLIFLIIKIYLVKILLER